MVGEGFGNRRQLDPGLKPLIRICQSFVREVDRCSGNSIGANEECTKMFLKVHTTLWNSDFIKNSCSELF